MIIDHDPNQIIHQNSGYQQDNTNYRGGRGGRGFNHSRGRGGYHDRGRGGPNDRGRGVQIYGRGRGRGNVNNDKSWNGSSQQDPNGLVKILVRGLLETDLLNERDSGLAACREWLEERANFGTHKPIEYVYLKSPRWEGDDMVFEVRKSEVGRILKSNGQLFHNVSMSVKRANHRDRESSGPNIATTDSFAATKIFKAVLEERYDVENRMLRLERLADDTRLQSIRTWDPNATTQKHTDFFQGLMRLCESQSTFPSREVKAQQVESISLTNNDLTTVAPVLGLAKAFPDVRNLDLSNNKIMSLTALNPFRGKFRRLDWLVISPNPIDVHDPNYAQTVIECFPSLRKLNGIQVRSDEAAAAAADTAGSGDELPIPSVKDNFQDENGIAESAIRQLIQGMDNDRQTLARTLYDDNSTFSLSYNPSAPRLDIVQSTNWDPHIKQSRNLKKVMQLDPRIRRIAKGVNAIESALQNMPPTRHPDLVNETGKYSFDCTPMPGVPHPHGHSVGGFKVDVRGSFEELDRNTGLPTGTRSFDRVFIIGPGTNGNQLRIVSDMLILRAEGGNEAFQSGATNAAPDLPLVPDSLTATMKTEEEIRTSLMVAEVSKTTGLTTEWSTMLLNESGWVFQKALEYFKTARVKGMLRNEYFVPESHAPMAGNPTGAFT
ncbi:MAG: hypothetical protein Q9201_000275 [Fulgogasparrea decipioides]